MPCSAIRVTLGLLAVLRWSREREVLPEIAMRSPLTPPPEISGGRKKTRTRVPPLTKRQGASSAGDPNV